MREGVQRYQNRWVCITVHLYSMYCLRAHIPTPPVPCPLGRSLLACLSVPESPLYRVPSISDPEQGKVYRHVMMPILITNVCECVYCVADSVYVCVCVCDMKEIKRTHPKQKAVCVLQVICDTWQ